MVTRFLEVLVKRAGPGVLVLTPLLAGCRGEAGSASPPSTVGAAPPAIPPAWASLNLPSAGLEVVSEDTDEHGFYADYRGSDRQVLLDDVARRLVAVGWERSCSAEDGYVLGFTKSDRQIAVKVDQVGALILSVFDEKGRDELLHGLCFGRYRAGPKHVMTPEEKEAFARQFLGEDDTEPSPTPDAAGGTGNSATPADKRQR